MAQAKVESEAPPKGRKTAAPKAPAAARGKATPAKPKTASKTPRAAASPKVPAPTLAEFVALRQQVEAVEQALSTRPTWEDLRALESRLSAYLNPALADSEAMEQLQEQLQTKIEELEELSIIVSEFQEQNEQAQQLLSQRSQKLQEVEARLERTQEQLIECEQINLEAEERSRVAEGFLREALLSLLSPGDEFNEELVEQIQTFLSL